MSMDEARFEAAMTTSQFVAQMQENQETFISNYQQAEMDEADLAFFRSQGPLRALALVEDWCPDVVAALPMLAKLADALGDDTLKLRVLLRDQNLDIADAHLQDGAYRAIPVFIFFDAQMGELGHFIERPAAVTNALQQAGAEFLAAHPDYPPDRDQRTEEQNAAFGAYRREFRASHRHEINRMLIADLRQLLT